MQFRNRIVGLIPSGGIGKRMKPFRALKELTTVGSKAVDIDGREKIIPKVLSEYTIENMTEAGAEQLLVIINENKSELLKFYGDGNQYKSHIAYLCQDMEQEYYGMPIALDEAYHWVKGKTVLMGMPDTIIQPPDSFKQLWLCHNEYEADLTLGVFPTNIPHRLAPVDFDAETGRVRKVYDKPLNVKIMNTWNAGVWADKFSELMHDCVRDFKENKAPGQEILLSDIFNLAIRQGLRVYCHFFEHGKCYDLGNIDEFIQIKEQIESESALTAEVNG